ncbi:hypothetical protein KUCAC02_024170, partial [Chaenocephalus aceratus]
ESFAQIECVLDMWGELRQTLIGGTGSSALYLLCAHTPLRCGNLIIPPIPNLLRQGQQHRAPAYHLSSSRLAHVTRGRLMGHPHAGDLAG